MARILMSSEVAVLAALGAALLLLLVEEVVRRLRDVEAVVIWRVHFPADLDPEGGLALLRALAQLPRTLPGDRRLAAETLARRGRIEHRLVVPLPWAEAVHAQVRAHLPDVQLEPVEKASLPRVTRAVELRLPQRNRTLRTDASVPAAAAMLATLQPLQADEEAWVQWVLAPRGAGPVPRPNRPLPAVGPLWLRVLGVLARPPQRPAQSLGEQRAKVAEPGFVAVVRLGVSGGTVAGPDNSCADSWPV